MKLKLDQIAECICNKVRMQPVDHLGGLYNGEFGILLFLHYYSRYSKDPEVTALTDAYTEKLLEQLGTAIRLHTFCGGLSGILYLFAFLQEKGFVDIDVCETESILENYLVREMKKDISKQYYDFMHGALGVGFYFLKKGTNLQAVKELIDFLHRTSDKGFGLESLKWKSVLNMEGQRLGYNISLSHGISSIVLFLARAFRYNVEQDKLVRLLEGAVNYLLSQEMDVDKYGSYFPQYSLEEETPISLFGSRLSWCYGDLGVAFSLWYAGNAANRQEWTKRGLDILLHSTRRVSPTLNGVVDAGICHGSSGLSMIYIRMYLETEYPDFLLAANYWLNLTLNQSTFEDGLAGYKSFFSGDWHSDYSLLMGVPGIGLAFLSYLDKNLQDWDQVFLLS